MSSLPALNTISNGTPADATEVNTNFQTIKTYIDGELIERDGSTAMTGELTLSSSSPSGALVAASKGYVDAQVAAAVPDGGVTTAKLADNAVTTAKIAAGAVGTTDIADDAVTDAKIGAPSLGSLDGGNVRYARYGNLVAVWTEGEPTTSVTLPSGYRPPRAVRAVMYNDGTGVTNILYIQTTGSIACGGNHFSVVFSTV